MVPMGFPWAFPGPPGAPRRPPGPKTNQSNKPKNLKELAEQWRSLFCGWGRPDVASTRRPGTRGRGGGRGRGKGEHSRPFDGTLCYVIMLPGLKSTFRAGFRCFPGSSRAKIRPGRPISTIA